LDHQRHRAPDVLRRHGRETVSFQGLESDFRYWFADDDAFVASVETRGAWVAGGGPVACCFAAEDDLARGAAELAASPLRCNALR